MKTPITSQPAKSSTTRTRDALRIRTAVRAGAAPKGEFYVRCDRSDT
ncbi:MAG: hypothetical protein H6719_29120 [Sandaracinaceae bacterium]|nr:hypothetical protein [Sandaracinaceae bacterium]